MIFKKYSEILIYVLISLLFILIQTSFMVLPVLAEQQPEFDLTAKSAILMETETGEVIYEKNPNLELPPASMTKIMTMLLVMEAVKAGKADFEDKILISERAASMGGSQVYLEPGEEMTLNSLMKSIAIASANDSSVAVAEYLYGTEEDFVERMNERAKELGLKNTYFYNSNGLPPSEDDVQGNYTCAYDLAVLSRELLKHPRVLEWTSTWIDYLRDGEFVLNNTNRLVRHYKGADGLKTGYTSAAKYCVTSTACQNKLRFISVIMGAERSKQRFKEAAKLLSYGFNTHQAVVIADKDKVIERINVWNARKKEVNIITPEDIYVPVRKGEEDNISKKIIIDKSVRAPLIKGDKAGKVKVFKGNLLIKDVDLIVDRNVKKASILQMVGRILRLLFNQLKHIFS